jgi:hypothetical protein
MTLYRVIRQSYIPTGGSIEWITYNSLSESYKACVLNKNVCCRLLMNGVIDRIEEDQRLIRITCDIDTVYWIQVINSSDEPLSPLPTIKDFCCNHA